MEEKNPLYVAFVVERDLEKVKYTLRNLACRIAVEPVHAHAFLRNGRDAFGRILDKKMVGKLAEIRQYLHQTRLTFAFVKTVGEFTFEEVRHDKSVEDCMADYRRKLMEKGLTPVLRHLENDTWDDPWKI